MKYFSITPQFPGLKPGDGWCLCALRWKEAYEAGVAPPVKPEATHEKGGTIHICSFLAPPPCSHIHATSLYAFGTSPHLWRCHV